MPDPAVPPRPDSSAAKATGAAVLVENLERTYKGGLKAVDGVNLIVETLMANN